MNNSSGGKSENVCRTRVYVWEFPVRLSHWVNAVSVFTLSFTGFFIGNPFIPVTANPAFVMGWMRFVHLVSGYALLSMIFLRLCWGFLGNRYASWHTWLPVRKEHWSEAWSDIKYHLFVGRKAPHAVGHSSLGNIIYIIIFALMLTEVATGFALFTVNHKTFVHMLLGGWLLAGLEISTVRLVHHLVMYALLVVAFAHIYMAWYLDTVEKNGLLGSMFGGFKFIVEGSGAHHGPRSR